MFIKRVVAVEGDELEVQLACRHCLHLQCVSKSATANNIPCITQMIALMSSLSDMMWKHDSADIFALMSDTAVCLYLPAATQCAPPQASWEHQQHMLQ